MVFVEGYHSADWPKIRVTRAGEKRRAAMPPVIAEITSDSQGRLPGDAVAVAAAAHAIDALLDR